MSYNNGGMHKRSLDTAPYQGAGGYPGAGTDMKRSRPDQMGGGGAGGGSGIYGERMKNEGSRECLSPRAPSYL